MSSESKTVEGCRSWLALAVIVLINLVTVGLHSGSIGVIIGKFNNEFGSDITSSSWIGSVAIAVFLCVSPIGSIIVGIVGHRYAVLIGALSSTGGLVISAFSEQVWQAVLSYGVIAGFGMSLVNITSVSSLSTFFDKRRQLAFSTQLLGRSAGVLIFPVISSELFKVLSYRDGMFGLASIAALSFTGIIIFPPKESKEEQDKKVEVVERSWCTYNKAVCDYLSLLHNPVLIVYYISTVLWNQAFSIPFVLLHKYVELKRPDDDVTPSLSLTIVGAAALVATLLIIFISVKVQIHALLVYLLSSSGMGVGLIVVTVSNHQVSIGAAAAIFGASAGLMLAVVPSLLQHLNGERNIRAAVSYSLFAGGIGSLTGPTAGAALQTVFNTEAAFYYGGVCGLLCAGTILVLLIVRRDVWKPVSVKVISSASQKELAEEQQQSEIV